MGRRRKNEIESFGEDLQGAAEQGWAVEVADGEGEVGVREAPMAEVGYISAEDLVEELEDSVDQIAKTALAEKDRLEGWVRCDEDGKMKLHPDMAEIIRIKHGLDTSENIRPRSDAGMAAYLPLSKEEEEYYIRQYKEHRDLPGASNQYVAERALEKLINSNEYWIEASMQQLPRGDLPFEDRKQEGKIGLMIGVDKFDVKRGLRLKTYGTFWIRHDIRRAVEETGTTVVIPTHVWDSMRKMHDAERKVQQQEKREATLEEIAELMQKKPQKVRELRGAERISIISIDGPVALDIHDRPLRDSLRDKQGGTDPEKETMHALAVRQVDRILAQLSPRELKVIKLSFGLNGVGRALRLNEIAPVMNLSPALVGRIQRRALEKLQEKGEMLREAVEMLAEE